MVACIIHKFNIKISKKRIRFFSFSHDGGHDGHGVPF